MNILKKCVRTQQPDPPLPPCTQCVRIDRDPPPPFGGGDSLWMTPKGLYDFHKFSKTKLRSMRPELILPQYNNSILPKSNKESNFRLKL